MSTTSILNIEWKYRFLEVTVRYEIGINEKQIKSNQAVTGRRNISTITTMLCEDKSRLVRLDDGGKHSVHAAQYWSRVSRENKIKQKL